MYSYGARIDDDSNAITDIDEIEMTSRTYGFMNGEPFEFVSNEIDTSLHLEVIQVEDIAVPANGGKNVQVSAPLISGKKLLGIVGWECSAWEVAPSKLTTVYNGGLIWFSLANASTSAKTVSFKITALYIPDSWTVS